MKRRRYLQTIASAGLVGLSGCASLPFLGPDDVPTAEQIKYIEYYPSVSKIDSPARVTVDSQETQLGVKPQTFGEFEKYEIYTVHPDGSGKKLGEIASDDFDDTDGLFVKTYKLSYAQNGSLLLILGVKGDMKYTYGAYHKEDGSFEQIAYTDE